MLMLFQSCWFGCRFIFLGGGKKRNEKFNKLAAIMRQLQQKLRHCYLRCEILTKFVLILIAEENHIVFQTPGPVTHCHFLVLFLSGRRRGNGESHPHRYCSFLCSRVYEAEHDPTYVNLCEEARIASLPFPCVLHFENQMLGYKFGPRLPSHSGGA